MTLIVAEGVDGAGKSTLIGDLAHALPDSVHILRRGPIERHPMEEYEWPLASYSPGYDTHLLLDRWHIGELIYGPLYRGVSQVTPAMRMHIDMVLDRLGALKILVDPPLPLVLQRLATRGEDFLQPQHVALVHDAYKEHCTSLNGWVTLTSPTKLKPDDIANAAIRLEEQAYLLDKFDSYVGPLQPQALLLGDRRNAIVHGRPNFHWAFVPYRDTSGHFLLTALDAVGFRDFGIANVNEGEDITELWETLGKPSICVLGQEALRGLRRGGFLDFEMKDAVRATVDHPQYVRRFKTSDMRAYGQRIKEAVSG